MKSRSNAAKTAKRRAKVEALAERPGTRGEGEAARAAIARLAAAPPTAKAFDSDFVRSCDPSVRRTYWDSDPKAPGFGVRVNPGGSKSFFLNYRVEGRERRIVIGPFPRWSVAAARDRAKELRRQIDRGDDPASDRRDRRDAATVQDLVDRYIADHLPRKKMKGGRLKDHKKMLTEIGKYLGVHTKVADVNFGDCQAMHQKIGELIGRHGPRRARANRILTVASKLFSMSLIPKAGEISAWRDAVKGNPCKGIERFPEQGRERFFSPDEFDKINDALDQYPGVAADCVRLIMQTGCRPAEALQAKFSEFDKEPGFWIKPASQTKQAREHKLPLNPQAIELIERRRKKRRSEWVFPGDKKGGHLAALHHVWSFVREKTGIGEARIYDLRHSFASAGAADGLSLPVIGKLLGHASPKTTQRYVHLDDELLREATTAIGKRIAGARS